MNPSFLLPFLCANSITTQLPTVSQHSNPSFGSSGRFSLFSLAENLSRSRRIACKSRHGRASYTIDGIDKKKRASRKKLLKLFRAFGFCECGLGRRHVPIPDRICWPARWVFYVCTWAKSRKKWRKGNNVAKEMGSDRRRRVCNTKRYKHRTGQVAYESCSKPVDVLPVFPVRLAFAAILATLSHR